MLTSVVFKTNAVSSGTRVFGSRSDNELSDLITDIQSSGRYRSVFRKIIVHVLTYMPR